jgi:hypothetical protein
VFLSVTGTSRTYSAADSKHVTLTPQHRQTPKPAAKLDPRIAPDERWPGMYRIKRPDGALSDIVNLVRARDALMHLIEAGRP